MTPSMMALGAASKVFIAYLPLLLTSSGRLALAGAPETCSNPQTSCQNTSAVASTCCFNAPGGQLLQASAETFTVELAKLTATDSILGFISFHWSSQFMDSPWPMVSPQSSFLDPWLTHSRPDHCDGTYDANCDASRAYTNITQILTAAGQTSLLSYMNTYWKNADGTDESFWEHEWGKHGTCISTLEPSCYTNYVPQEEVVDFFNKVVSLFKTLPSYTWLSDAGIVPSSTATYTSAAILAALKAPRGVTAVIQCENTNQLDEIWYVESSQP